MKYLICLRNWPLLLLPRYWQWGLLVVCWLPEPILEQFLFICNLPELGMGRKRPRVVAGMLFCISSSKARIKEKVATENHTCLGCALLAAQCHVSRKVFRKSWPTFCTGFHLCLINSQSKEQAGFYWNQTVANQQILIFTHTVVTVTVQMEKQGFLSCMKVLPLQPIFHSAANMVFYKHGLDQDLPLLKPLW